MRIRILALPVALGIASPAYATYSTTCEGGRGTPQVSIAFGDAPYAVTISGRWGIKAGGGSPYRILDLAPRGDAFAFNIVTGKSFTVARIRLKGKKNGGYTGTMALRGRRYALRCDEAG